MTTTAHDVAVAIGRFQPFHNGHAAVLAQALAAAPRVVVVIGSAHQARTPRNPFSWQERAAMIRMTLPEAERERVVFMPMRDYYDDERWTAAVRRGVEALLAQGGAAAAPAILLLGHRKDATSDYLLNFPGWQFASVERVGAVNAWALRDAFFGNAGTNLDAALAALVDQAPPSTLAFLRTWAALPVFAELVLEWTMLREYKAAWAFAPYPPVFVTVDAIVRCADQVLLIRRGQAPGKGLYAVPGGFIEPRETAYQSALRELKEETRMSLLAATMRHSLKATAVFDHPDRSQRGRTITHAHYFDLGDRELPETVAGDDAAAVEWVAIDKLATIEDRFLDDHFHMLDHFLGLTAE
jgi:bifunctional NMN adenylyltransferase/nudix hydrolase